MTTVFDKVFYPLEPDTTIKIGDRVRSFDFAGDATCYWVGTVTDIQYWRGTYEISVDFQVWEGKRSKDNYCEKLYPPINGEQGIFGRTRGVQRMVKGETK